MSTLTQTSITLGHKMSAQGLRVHLTKGQDCIWHKKIVVRHINIYTCMYICMHVCVKIECRKQRMNSLEDDHWITKEIPDRHLCIHEHSALHSLCLYLCPYMDYTSSSYNDTLYLSDISEFEDLMTTSRDEDIPALDEDTGY